MKDEISCIVPTVLEEMLHTFFFPNSNQLTPLKHGKYHIRISGLVILSIIICKKLISGLKLVFLN